MCLTITRKFLNLFRTAEDQQPDVIDMMIADDLLFEEEEDETF